MKDEIFKEPIKKQFEFDASVASVFDDMIGRSVPFYEASTRLSSDRSGLLDCDRAAGAVCDAPRSAAMRYRQLGGDDTKRPRQGGGVRRRARA